MILKNLLKLLMLMSLLLHVSCQVDVADEDGNSGFVEASFEEDDHDDDEDDHYDEEEDEYEFDEDEEVLVETIEILEEEEEDGIEICLEGHGWLEVEFGQGLDEVLNMENFYDEAEGVYVLEVGAGYCEDEEASLIVEDEIDEELSLELDSTDYEDLSLAIIESLEEILDDHDCEDEDDEEED